MAHKKASEVIAVDDPRDALAKIEYAIEPGDIVMMRTRVSTRGLVTPTLNSYIRG